LCGFHHPRVADIADCFFSQSRSAEAPKKEGYRIVMKASAYHLKPADIKKLTIAAPNFRDRCIVKTLYWAGLRRHELTALDVRDIDFERKRITVQNGKGGKTRIVPIIDDEYLNRPPHRLAQAGGCVLIKPRQRPLAPKRELHHRGRGEAGWHREPEPTAPPPQPPTFSATP
jgi:integrase